MAAGSGVGSLVLRGPTPLRLGEGERVCQEYFEVLKGRDQDLHLLSNIVTAWCWGKHLTTANEKAERGQSSFAPRFVEPWVSPPFSSQER